jgi:hypothetical protein
MTEAETGAAKQAKARAANARQYFILMINLLNNLLNSLQNLQQRVQFKITQFLCLHATS